MSFLDTPELQERDRLLERIEQAISHLPEDGQREIVLNWQDDDRLGDMTPVLERRWDAPTGGPREELERRCLAAIAHVNHERQLQILLGWFRMERLRVMADGLEEGTRLAS